MVYGAPGQNDKTGYVRVNKFNGASWLQLGNDIVGDAEGDWAGRSVALSSDGLTVSMDIAHVFFTKYVEWCGGGIYSVV